MSFDFTFTKYQAEIITTEIDLSGLTEIQNGEVITSHTVQIALDGLDATTDILVSSSNTTNSVTFKVQNGSINKKYEIIILVNTDGLHTRQKVGEMTVLTLP